MSRRVTALLVVLALAALAAGCGGKSSSGTTTTAATTTTTSSASVSTADWANNLCGAFVTWTTSVRAAGSSLTSNPTKASVRAAGEEMRNSTDKLRSDLQSLGKPNTPSGAKAKQTLDELAGHLQTDVATIDKAIQGLTNGGKVVPAVATVSTTLQSLGTQVRSSFDTLQKLDAKGELEHAFKNAAACKQLAGQGG